MAGLGVRVSGSNSPPGPENPDLGSRQDSPHERHHSLACTECKRRNYSTTKNKKKTTGQLEFSKYCRFCRKHTAHRETK